MTRRQRTSRAPGVHPTATRILEQAVGVLTEDGFDRFSVQRVLDGAGVSRATLYNHFADVDTLIEEALVEAFAQESSAIQERFVDLLAQSGDRDSFRLMLRAFLEGHGRMPSEVRMRRANTISISTTRPTLAAAIAVVQDEVIAGWQSAIETAQQRGFIRADLDARAVAILVVQAIPLGRIADDASSEPVGDDRWTALFIEIVERAILAPDV
jgi:AcrR family transcriptional regulator